MFDEIRNAQGELLDYTYSPARSPAGDGSTALVLIGHGVTGNKDRPWAVALADALSQAGIPAMRLSFSGNGASAGHFAQSTISKEVCDLGAVIDAVGARRIVYSGHSMGGAVGVLRAVRDPRITLLVSLAGMVHTQDFAQRKFGHLKSGVDCMWEKPECPLSQEFLNDMRSIATVVELGASVSIPWLLVHGTADEVVPVRDSTDIRAAAGGHPELVELAGADHVFSGRGTADMTAAVVPWIAEHL